MAKRNGFTLIELLVVVAIIGILAAVGVTAYSGYTSSAKKSASKAVHATVVKYISAELARCNIEEKIFEGKFNCVNKSNPSSLATSVSIFVPSTLWGQGTSSPKFKHPNGTHSAVSGRTPGYYNRVTCNSMWEYNTLIENTASEITIYTCPNDKSADKITTIIPIE